MRSGTTSITSCPGAITAPELYLARFMTVPVTGESSTARSSVSWAALRRSRMSERCRRTSLKTLEALFEAAHPQALHLLLGLRDCLPCLCDAGGELALLADQLGFRTPQLQNLTLLCQTLLQQPFRIFLLLLDQFQLDFDGLALGFEPCDLVVRGRDLLLEDGKLRIVPLKPRPELGILVLDNPGDLGCELALEQMLGEGDGLGPVPLGDCARLHRLQGVQLAFEAVAHGLCRGRIQNDDRITSGDPVALLNQDVLHDSAFKVLTTLLRPDVVTVPGAITAPSTGAVAAQVPNPPKPIARATAPPITGEPIPVFTFIMPGHRGILTGAVPRQHSSQVGQLQ